MSRLWASILNLFDKVGDMSGCHQTPERCLKIKNYQFPICARCTGVAIGQILAIILLIIGIRIDIKCSIVILGIMGFDWFIQYIKLLESNNIRRLITGILGGFGIVNIYYYIIVFIYNYIVTNLN